MRWRVCAALAVTAAVFPAAAQAGPPDWIEVKDGVTQPVFSLDDAVTETLYVQSVVDSDQNGRRDLVRIHVSRPGETETEGIDVPVVFEHSPYRGEFGDAENHPVDFDVLPQENLRPGHGGDRTQARRGWGRSRARADLPGGLDDRYVPRGYAVILGEGIGSAGSDGCPTIGDADETLSTRAVIDWLNGRARAFDADGRPVRADWTTGAVGMTGVSYDATLPNMVATTGVQGLKTIVPISGISSWYDYYRANGLVVAPHSNTQGVGENFYLGEDTDVLAKFTAGNERSAGPCAHVLQRLAEQGRERDTDDSLIQAPDARDPNRLAYLSPVLRRAVHVSGTPEVTLRASVDNRNAANLTAVLVDYGPDAPTMITRGWMDVQNRSGPSRSTPIRQGREYAFSFDLQPDDYVVPAGHRIGLVVVSTDHDYTIRPLPGTRLSLAPDRSELRLPVVGGRSALGF